MYNGYGHITPALRTKVSRDVSFMTSWDIGPETLAMYPAFMWQLGLPQRGRHRDANGYLGVQCVRGKLNTVLFSVWDSCFDEQGRAMHACYTGFGKNYYGPTPEHPNRRHERPAPQHPNCMRNCQDCGGAKATGTKCMLRDELTALALPCAGKYEMRMRMTHPQRTAKFSSAIDAHNKEYSVTGAEYTVTFWDRERDLSWVVGVVVFGGLAADSGLTGVTTFYEQYDGSVGGCETTTSESRARQCTNRVTREVIFNDSPRTYVGAKQDTHNLKDDPTGCDLNNAYALRRGLMTSEYSPGVPVGTLAQRGYTAFNERNQEGGGWAGKAGVVPYGSPYDPNKTPAPTPPPTPPQGSLAGWTAHPKKYLGGYVSGVGSQKYLIADAQRKCASNSGCGGVTCSGTSSNSLCTLRAGRTLKTSSKETSYTRSR